MFIRLRTWYQTNFPFCRAQREQEAPVVAQLEKEIMEAQKQIMQLNQQQSKMQAENKNAKSAINHLSDQIVKSVTP